MILKMSDEFERACVALSFRQLQSIQKSYENNMMIPIDRIYHVSDCEVSEELLRKIRKLMIKFIKMYFSNQININDEIYLEKSNLRIVKSKYTSSLYGKNKEDVILVPNILFQYRVSKYYEYNNLIILLG